MSIATYSARRWGRMVKMSEPVTPESLKAAGHALLGGMFSKRELKRYISRKQYPVKDSTEFCFKRPFGLRDNPYDLRCILAGKFLTVRFSKLKKLRRDMPHLFAPSDKPKRDLYALIVGLLAANKNGGAENNAI